MCKKWAGEKKESTLFSLIVQTISPTRQALMWKSVLQALIKSGNRPAEVPMSCDPTQLCARPDQLVIH